MPKHLKIWGPMAGFGLVVAALVFGIDQGYKTWMLHYYNIAERQPVKITPFLDLVIVFNKGISYGWLKGLGPWPLIAGQSLVTIFLWLWLAGSKRKFDAIVLGVIVGGALGNIADRIIYGGVADFFFLHAYGFSWYVFNLADVAVVAGAAILVYTSFTDKTE